MDLVPLHSGTSRWSAGLLVKLWWHSAWWVWMVYNWSLMLILSPCQAYGMSVLPLNLIKGTRSILYERLENTEDTEEVEHQIDKLKAKVSVCVNWIQIRALLALFRMSCLSVAVLEVSGSQLVGCQQMQIMNAICILLFKKFGIVLILLFSKDALNW